MRKLALELAELRGQLVAKIGCPCQVERQRQPPARTTGLSCTLNYGRVNDPPLAGGA
jgi:hypothetical protein